MSLKTFTVQTATCVRCGGAAGPEVIPGDTVQIWLDQDANSNFPEWVEGTVVSVEPLVESSTAPRNYVLQYESDDLEGAAEVVRDCDVVSVTCVGCCALINAYLALLAEVNAPEASLWYKFDDDGNLVLQAVASSRQISGNPGVPVTIASYVFKDPDGVVIAEDGDPDSRTVVLTSAWSGGAYSVLVTDSEGLMSTATVYVVPIVLGIRKASAVVADGLSSVTVPLNAGEEITGPTVKTAGTGLFVESVVSGVITLSNTNGTGGDITVTMLIVKALP